MVKEIYEEELSDLPHHEMTITNHGDYRGNCFPTKIFLRKNP